MNMKLPSVVKQPSIYYGFSTWKTFYGKNITDEENFTLGEFTAVNMKSCGHLNVSKNIEIKDSDAYIPLDILLKFFSLEIRE